MSHGSPSGVKAEQVARATLPSGIEGGYGGGGRERELHPLARVDVSKRGAVRRGEALKAGLGLGLGSGLGLVLGSGLEDISARA